MSEPAHRGTERSHRTRARSRAFALLVGILSLSAVVAGCASTPAPEPEASPSERMNRGLRALQAGEYGNATRDLMTVRDACRGKPLGEQALLLWAATELDPRNPDPDLAGITRAAALHLAGTAETSWTRPLAESLYLLALERGAPVPDPVTPAALDSTGVEEAASRSTGASRHPLIDATPAEDPCRSIRAVASADSAVSITDSAAPARDSAAATTALRLPELPGKPFTTRISRLENRTEELEGTTLQLRRIIAELEQELERIREILRP